MYTETISGAHKLTLMLNTILSYYNVKAQIWPLKGSGKDTKYSAAQHRPNTHC